MSRRTTEQHPKNVKQRKLLSPNRMLAVWLLCLPCSRALATTTNVMVGDDYFSPSVVGITEGDTVTWKWKGRLDHTSTSTNLLWDSGRLQYGATFSYTFTAAGSYPYKCSIHSSIQTGSVEVAPGSSSAVRLSAPQIIKGSLWFSYNTVAGWRYVVQKATPLAGWLSIQTNNWDGGNVTFRDDVTNVASIYRVLVLPETP